MCVKARPPIEERGCEASCYDKTRSRIIHTEFLCRPRVKHYQTGKLNIIHLLTMLIYFLNSLFE